MQEDVSVLDLRIKYSWDGPDFLKFRHRLAQFRMRFTEGMYCVIEGPHKNENCVCVGSPPQPDNLGFLGIEAIFVQHLSIVKRHSNCPCVFSTSPSCLCHQGLNRLLRKLLLGKGMRVQRVRGGRDSKSSWILFICVQNIWRFLHISLGSYERRINVKTELPVLA